MKRSVGVGAITLCVVLAACKDDKCSGPNRDTAGCSSSGHGGGSGGYVGSARGSSEGSSSTARGGFGSTGSSGGGSGGE